MLRSVFCSRVKRSFWLDKQPGVQSQTRTHSATARVAKGWLGEKTWCMKRCTAKDVSRHVYIYMWVYTFVAQEESNNVEFDHLSEASELDNDMQMVLFEENEDEIDPETVR